MKLQLIFTENLRTCVRRFSVKISCNQFHIYIINPVIQKIPKRAIPCGIGVRDKRICTNNNLYHRKRNDIWMSYGKFDDKGDNPTNNPNIHNVQGNYKLSPGQQQVVACWSATPDNRKSVENPGFFQ